MRKSLSLIKNDDFVNYENLHSITSKGRVRLNTMIRPDIRAMLNRIADSRRLSIADVLETIICEYLDVGLNDKSNWLSVEDAAAHLNVSISTIRRYLGIIKKDYPSSVRASGKRRAIELRADTLVSVFNGVQSGSFPDKEDVPSGNKESLGAKKSGFVYLISDGNLFKIGYSVNPISRLSQIKTGNAAAELIDYFPASVKDEKALHTYFKVKRVNLEWFRLGISDINKIREYFSGQGYVYESINAQTSLF